MNGELRTPRRRKTDVYAAIENALRCTEHIPERGIRAAYIATDLRISGFLIQAVGRDERGRFAR